MQNSRLSRDFYTFAIFFVTMYIIAYLIQGVVALSLGSRIITFGSFYPWLLVLTFIFLISSFSILRYFFKKGYRFAFFAGTAATLASFCQYVLVFNLLLYRDLQKIYVPFSIFTISIGILYAASLVVSPAGARPWLKRGGLLALVAGPVLLVTLIWAVNTADVGLRSVLENIHRATGLVSILVPVFFLINLIEESKLVADQQVAPPRVLRELLKVIAIFALILAGFGFASESARAIAPFRLTPEAIRQAKKFGAQNYVSEYGDTLRYRFVVPMDYDSTKRYPLIVCLHHGGAHGTDNVQQMVADPAPYLLSDSNRRHYPAFIFMPQSPKGAGFGRSGNYPTIDTLVFQALASIEKRYQVDTTRRYVMGISGGGYGSWNFISLHPEMFAAAIPICGGGDVKYAPRLVDMPLWAFHGARDRLAPVSGTRDMIAAIKKAGGNPRYSEFSLAGHDIWSDVRNTPGLMDWLFAQERK